MFVLPRRREPSGRSRGCRRARLTGPDLAHRRTRSSRVSEPGWVDNYFDHYRDARPGALDLLAGSDAMRKTLLLRRAGSSRFRDLPRRPLVPARSAPRIDNLGARVGRLGDAVPARAGCRTRDDLRHPEGATLPAPVQATCLTVVVHRAPSSGRSLVMFFCRRGRRQPAHCSLVVFSPRILQPRRPMTGAERAPPRWRSSSRSALAGRSVAGGAAVPFKLAQLGCAGHLGSTTPTTSCRCAAIAVWLRCHPGGAAGDVARVRVDLDTSVHDPQRPLGSRGRLGRGSGRGTEAAGPP